MNFFEQITFDISESKLSIFIILILIVICILIILREVRCWYWKINEMIYLQRQEIEALHDIIELQIEEMDLLKSNIFKNNKSDINKNEEDETNED